LHSFGQSKVAALPRRNGMDGAGPVTVGLICMSNFAHAFPVRTLLFSSAARVYPRVTAFMVDCVSAPDTKERSSPRRNRTVPMERVGSARVA